MSLYIKGVDWCFRVPGSLRCHLGIDLSQVLVVSMEMFFGSALICLDPT